MTINVRPIDLKRQAAAIAGSYGDKGAIIISIGEDTVRIGVSDGLKGEEIQNALCVGIHYNFCAAEGELED